MAKDYATINLAIWGDDYSMNNQRKTTWNSQQR
ncbi:hypothetical protein KEK_08327 [Mycolicibacterium thermoresistibile ATCC 19527]|uniref:Uncharacterized protein n=1 Tax=Mycolicibacterium thermoresistibile (strain ATCC 19527 / DSM 44167 / CIP 105390 / JCM 6362 / NCTC 10409 / 316) TaxID=1078020 RepID=G7CF94_MYCT3|nr:hypothetical protein KEK_08327 [Mycolicibacterium thermoresistibile ATCC 19527]SNW20364.1 Uncharacterised protein [Mycolicibacterium thermoresistibile]